MFSFLDEGDMIFSLEEDQLETGNNIPNNKSPSGPVTLNQSVSLSSSTGGSASLQPTTNKTSQAHSPLRPSRRSTHVFFII